MILLKTGEGQEVEINEGAWIYWQTSDGNAGCPDWEELSEESAERMRELANTVGEIMEALPIWLE